jgi:hypothetical protein
MSDRERWTVYPLILFCLAVSLRDKLAPPVHLSIPDLQCQQIELVRSDLTPGVRLGISEEGGGLIEVLDKNANARLKLGSLGGKSGFIEVSSGEGTPAIHLSVDAESNTGIISTFAPDNSKRIVLDAQGETGRITTLNASGRPVFVIASDEQGTGFSLVTDKEGRIHVGLTALVRAQPSADQPQEHPDVTEPPPGGEREPSGDSSSTTTEADPS